MVQVGVESENGWRPAKAGPDILEWVTVPGTSVSLQLMKGPPSRLLRAWAADWNAYIEPLRDADSAGFTPTNSVATSNHLNGTAIDLNWNSHPFHVRGTLNGGQMVVLREMLDFYEDTVFWAGDWTDPVDEMHSQCGYGSWNNRHTDDFIARKIRADGFSTFRREGAAPAPAPALSRVDRYASAIIAEGRRLGITPRGIKIAISVALVETNLTMYANSNDPPSLQLPHDAVGSDHMSSGIFQQQTSWGPLADRMDVTCSATIFFTVDNGPGVRGLTKIRERINGRDGALYDYNDASRSPGFYAQKVQGSAFPDRYDQRFGEAEQMYNRLAAIITEGDDELTPDQDKFLREIHAALFNDIPSQSKYRTTDAPLWKLHEFIKHDNARLHEFGVERAAQMGDREALALVKREADKGDKASKAVYDYITGAP